MITISLVKVFKQALSVFVVAVVVQLDPLLVGTKVRGGDQTLLSSIPSAMHEDVSLVRDSVVCASGFCYSQKDSRQRFRQQTIEMHEVCAMLVRILRFNQNMDLLEKN